MTKPCLIVDAVLTAYHEAIDCHCLANQDAGLTGPFVRTGNRVAIGCFQAHHRILTVAALGALHFVGC